MVTGGSKAVENHDGSREQIGEEDDEESIEHRGAGRDERRANAPGRNIPGFTPPVGEEAPGIPGLAIRRGGEQIFVDKERR
jgi:hypothetical protein